MNGLDLIILIVLGLFFTLGLYWGLIRQVLAVVGLIVGVMVAGRFGGNVADWLSSFISDPMVTGALGFLGLLMLVSSIASLIASILHTFVGLLFLGWLDHLLGGLLGLLQASIAVTVLVVVMHAFPLPLWNEALANSRFAGSLLRLGDLFGGILPAV
ncbi:MAG: CvpA family protein [Candidatus Viridilinea halotolerans]|uniref:CvpA family protein n=1 Tax=Candidatus Viridilinea halotolerans TaxID=2491704 RepID=A0A426TSY6_9CHLR|nr:MAG: CvpA family protein [Candidatus Viridilinea halotolerans]